LIFPPIFWCSYLQHPNKDSVLNMVIGILQKYKIVKKNWKKKDYLQTKNLVEIWQNSAHAPNKKNSFSLKSWQFFSIKKGNLWQKYFHLTFWGCPDVKIRHPKKKKKKNTLLLTLSTRVFLFNFVILKMWQFFFQKIRSNLY